jgi:hypothetical protein
LLCKSLALFTRGQGRHPFLFFLKVKTIMSVVIILGGGMGGMTADLWPHNLLRPFTAPGGAS